MMWNENSVKNFSSVIENKVIQTPENGDQKKKKNLRS